MNIHLLLFDQIKQEVQRPLVQRNVHLVIRIPRQFISWSRHSFLAFWRCRSLEPGAFSLPSLVAQPILAMLFVLCFSSQLQSSNATPVSSNEARNLSSLFSALTLRLCVVFSLRLDSLTSLPPPSSSPIQK